MVSQAKMSSNFLLNISLSFLTVLSRVLVFRACLYEGGGPQIGEATCLGGVKK